MCPRILSWCTALLVIDNQSLNEHIISELEYSCCASCIINVGNVIKYLVTRFRCTRVYNIHGKSFYP